MAWIAGPEGRWINTDTGSVAEPHSGGGGWFIDGDFRGWDLPADLASVLNAGVTPQVNYLPNNAGSDAPNRFSVGGRQFGSLAELQQAYPDANFAASDQRFQNPVSQEPGRGFLSDMAGTFLTDEDAFLRIPPVQAALGGMAGSALFGSQAPSAVTDLSFPAGGTPVGSTPGVLENLAGGATDAPWGVNPQGANYAYQDPAMLDVYGPGGTYDASAAGAGAAGGAGGAGAGAGAGVNPLPVLGAAGAAAAGLGGASGGDYAPQDPGALDVYGNSSAEEYGAPAEGQVPGWLAQAMGGVSQAAKWLKDNPEVARMISGVGVGAMGAYASNRQAGALTDLANKYAEYGAPSRGRFEASMAPGFDPNSIPGYSTAVDNSMDALLRRLSTQGNPFGNPGGLIEARKAVVSGTAMPALNEYRRLNLAGGGLANLNAAIPNLDTSAIGQRGNVYNAIGYGIDRATNPPSKLEDILRTMKGLT